MKQSILLILALIFVSCSSNSDSDSNEVINTNQALFSKISTANSGITFTNKIVQTNAFNFSNYTYIYIGSGIAVLDYNNDGLQDLYFVSNFGPNKLYKNNGDFNFEDVTLTSRTEDYAGFSTGVSVIDVNQDGYPDLYVSKAGSLDNDELRKNLLFVNQKDGTFNEEAKKWGLDFAGYTTQAYPIDYDNDGDMDLYLVNHRNDFKNVRTVSGAIQSDIQYLTSDHLFRNDGNTFKNVTEETGTYNKTWGLSAVVSDFNDDGWDDIYICNDFTEPDVLYINQQNGTFKNEINSRLKHISYNSMGSDYADLNNDLAPDLMTVDMLSDNYARSKENMASMNIELFNNMVAVGYHHAYMANTLHFNNGDGKFLETGQLSGVTKTDWSWAPLLADLDNDGLKDIYVTNGVDRDYNNQDITKEIEKLVKNKTPVDLEDVINMYPTEAIVNHVYKNKGDLNFEKSMENWGLNEPSYSYGAAYADLDNDGDLEIITNNLNDPASIYKNNSNQNFLQVALKGSNKNPLAIGAKVYVESNSGHQFQELYLARGYQSSVSPVLNFGLGTNQEIKKVSVQWADGMISTVENPKKNDLLTINYNSATATTLTLPRSKSEKRNTAASELGVVYQHKENGVDDYAIQLLIPQNQSSKGTGIIKGDVNNDGLEDFFVGNAANAAAALYIQNASGKFTASQTTLWNKEAAYEDANALFFDADDDGDQDLYVVSAGYELEANSNLLQDRLYLNNGQGQFTKQSNALPEMLASGKTVTAADIDGDGDLDLFVGGNVLPKKYPLASASFLLENNNGTFKDITPNNEGLESPGMISEAIFTDYDGDNDADLLLVGEWMKPTFFANTNGSFVKQNIPSFDKKEGWWFSAAAEDMDGDGDIDYFFGNLGKNNKFSPSEKKPLYIYAKDFDDNGSFDVALSKINEGKVVPVRGKECSSQQNPFLLEKIQSYKEFASLDMDAIYGADQLDSAEKRTAYSFETVYAQNNGDGSFTLTSLPNTAQLGPTLSFVIEDVNNDGNLDVMGVGAIYDAEVETIRYDSNHGYVLLGDTKGSFTHSKIYDPYISTDAKDITPLTITGKQNYVVVSNNAPLEIFTFQQ